MSMTQEPSADSPEYAEWLKRTLRPQDFEALPEDDLAALSRFAVRETRPAGTTLFRQGDIPQAIYLIEEGEVELVYETKLERLVMQLLRGGASLGELPVFLATRHSYTAVTRVETTVLRFTLDTVRALVEIYPHICFRWLRLVSRRLDRAHERLLELSGGSALERLSSFLLNEAEERGALTLEITQHDLASTLALSRQTVSRALGQLSDLGSIERSRSRITIRSEDQLRQHASGLRRTK